jgi:hypothetical protein
MNAEQNRFALETDARSRVTIYLINRANSKSICQFGDLTHAPHGGFISGDGQVRVSDDASYIAFKLATIQDSDYILSPSNSWTWAPAPWATVIPPELCERINQVSPDQIPSLLTELTGQADFVFLSRSLQLDKLDFDHIHGTMTRAFVENTPSVVTSIPKDYKSLPIRDHDGFFVRMNVFCNSAVFEYKIFEHPKFGICHFLFIPKHPGVWFKNPNSLAPNDDIVLDTRISDILNGPSPANAGLIDAGDIAKLDWECFLWHKVFYIWRSNESQSRNTFASALKFVAEAKKHGIEVVILRFSASFGSDGQKLLKFPAIIKQACAYGIDIPANLKSTGYVDCSIPQDIFISTDIPAFWQNGGTTLFYGPGHIATLRNLLRVFRRIPSDAPDDVPVSQGTDMLDGVDQYVFPKKKVGLLYPPSTSARISNLVRNAKAAIPRISSAIFSDDGKLETTISNHGIEVLFIAYADELPEKELASVLDLCGRMRIVVGAFTATEVVSASDAEMELVSQCFYVNANDTNPDSVFAKDMKSRIVKEFVFEGDGTVSVTDSDETSMNRKA